MGATTDGLTNYLRVLDPLASDMRTRRTAHGIIAGIIATGSLRMNQVALFPHNVFDNQKRHQKIGDKFNQKGLCAAL